MGVIIAVLSAALLACVCGLAAALFHIRKMKRECAVSLETDEMTGLLARSAFMSEGKTILENNSSSAVELAMLVFDVEELGKINTLFGTDVGDSVIKAFAKALRSIAPAGSILSRVNTDDFALLTPCDSEASAVSIAEGFGKVLSEQFPERALREQVNYFAGICMYDGHDDIYTLFNKANLGIIMKQEGVRIQVFTREMENRMVEQELLRSEMVKALETGEFELYYQPKISFKTGKMLGAEALIRWHHPTKGFVSPNDFIPLAEKTGIITMIDEWGLYTACRQCKEWQDAGLPPIKVSVNMSQEQFYRTDVYSTISNALKLTGLSAEYLEIEVTETMAMKDIDRTISILKKIRSLGVSISMDDFGSGYSSLSALKTIPLDILKIDRSLVCDIDENSVSKQITGAIVELGKAMKLIVLAEGVENKEQIEFLAKIGCDLAQGYYYSKPRPAADIAKMLNECTA